jgi:uncharacterized membrane protein YdjX (TVP38/TMEM64 family)
MAATALLVVAGVAIGAGLHLSAVVVLASLVVIATGLTSQLAAVPAVVVIAWMTCDGFVAPPYLDLHLTGHAPLGNALVIACVGAVGAAAGIARRWWAGRVAFRRACQAVLAEADAMAKGGNTPGSDAGDHAA